jgi:SAM-dependent methyltransferase
MKKLCLLFVCLTCQLFAFVEHKDDFIDIYLSNISSHMDEKTELLEHIKKNLNGTYLDIGTGGDAIAVMLKDIPKNAKAVLIAADIDPLVLESIKTRRPEINQFLTSKTGPKVNLVAMCATNMSAIKDSSISGLGASALMHEVYSYVPPKGAMDQFVGEVCRVLEKDGVLIYRDPKWVDDPFTSCLMIVKSDMAKYYTTLFLPKFLDRKFSSHRDYKNDCSKPDPFKTSDIKFNVYFHHCSEPKHLTFDEFVNTPTATIDYAKNFSLEAPKGLIAEIQRHYLMYLRNEFIPGFIEPRFFKEDINVVDLSKDEREMMEDFCYRKKISITNNIIKTEQFKKIFNDYSNLVHIFENGFRVNLDDNPELIQAINNLTDEKGVNRNILFLHDPKTVVIDPKLLSLLYNGKDKGIFKYFSKEEKFPNPIFDHLKLEGEEHYFYKTTDDLITYFGQLSTYLMKNTHKHNYVLSPIDKDHIKEIKRDYYKYILKRDMHVIDQYGNIHDPVTEKNVIHFKLQSLNKALEIYEALIQNQPASFPNLKQWIDNLQKESD